MVVAVALVVPPLTGMLLQALKIDGTHAHFDHVWHPPSLSDLLEKHHDDDASAKQAAQHDHGSKAHNDHIHLTVMAMAPSYVLDMADLSRSYAAALDVNRLGLDFSPPGRPPQTIS